MCFALSVLGSRDACGVCRRCYQKVAARLVMLGAGRSEVVMCLVRQKSRHIAVFEGLVLASRPEAQRRFDDGKCGADSNGY